jgi:diacylglycerol kinase (ATP)
MQVSLIGASASGSRQPARSRPRSAEPHTQCARFVHLIINPTAGAGRAGTMQAGLVSDVRRRFGPGVSSCITTEPSEATHSARTAIQGGATLILVAGGDGTIQEAVNGFFENGLPLNPCCELGVLSCGTGRGFANSVGLPDSVEEQLARIVVGPVRLLDVGRARYTDADATPAERLFVNECQAGIGTAVVRAVGMGH